MPFLRTKKINSSPYCYLVQNHHTKKGPRQKVKKYLGRVIKLEKKEDLNFSLLFPLIAPNNSPQNKISKKELLFSLIKFELLQHGFQEKKDFFVKDALSFHLSNFQTTHHQKTVLFSLNEGFLCPFTLRRILNFQKTNNFQQDAHLLARYFIEAGLKPPQEIFIQYYQKC